ncbi:MAG: methylenetetrahydrofolate--tRNA-(uracil(54)-C(5))-methyltransferase (FADH(2)-oxidizing) TrmFO, partial [Bacillota bacterium]
MSIKIKVIGGGLAGVEAAYQLLKAGFAVDMYEMRPVKMTPAHKTAGLGELVCSNSLKSTEFSGAQGLLKAEMRLMNSLVLKVAEATKVPAGNALAVDREAFSKGLEEELRSFSSFNLIKEECTEITDYTIVATGPLTSEAMCEKIAELHGGEYLHFYDAVAPIVTKESIDMDRAFFQSRYDKGEADYLNCYMNKEEYDNFVTELVSADRVILKKFEKGDIFEGCMPVEVMAGRGHEALRFGPLKPVGLGRHLPERPYAIVQLRMEDNYDSLYNLVGFQTNLTFKEQKRVFGLIPALKNAEFVRYGVMHRNTYMNSPKLLTEHYSLKTNGAIFFAGQMTGVEGYMESAMSGLIAL